MAKAKKINSKEVTLPGFGLKSKAPVFVAFDLETTGFNPDNDAVIEVGVFTFTHDENGNLIRLKEYEQLINPGKEVPIETELITGIKTEHLTGKPGLKDILPTLNKMLNDGDYILGHNVNFDISFLKKHIKIRPQPIDSQFFSELFFPGLPSYSLDVLPFELKIDRGNAHRALDDAKVSAEVFLGALRQYRSLATNQEAVTDLFKKVDLVEAEILEQALGNIKNQKNTWTPQEPEDKTFPTVKKLINVVNDALVTQGSKIIIHTVVNNASDSVIAAATNFYEKTSRPVVITAEHRPPKPILEKALFLERSERLICEYRLKNLINRDQLNSSEAILAAKLLVSEVLEPNFLYWPKLSGEERFFLPQLMADTDLCADHRCRSYKTIQKNKQGSLPLITTHSNFWRMPADILPKGADHIIADFDEAIEQLTRALEKKVSIDFLPNILRAVPWQNKKVEELKKLITDKNDLFWGLLSINFKDDLEVGPVQLTLARRSELEFQKVLGPAKKIISVLEDLVEELKKSRDEYALAFTRFLDGEVVSLFSPLIENNDNYHLLLDQWENRISIKLTASYQKLAEEFSKRLDGKTVMTGATGVESITSHYITLVNIHDWPVEIVKLKNDRETELKLVRSATPVLETTIKVLLSNDYKKAVIIAKNAKEVGLYAEHLKANLGEEIEVFYLDKTGSGSNKAIYQFALSNRAILIIPPRGRALFTPWPALDLAIIATIPFPVPEPGLGFLEHGLPRAMLAYKTLVSKILKSQSGNTKLFMMDDRLVSADYGKKFVELAEKMCGCPAEEISVN